MSVSWQQLDPVVDITLEDGAHRRLLLELDGDGIPVEVAESPDEGFPNGIIMGDSPQYNSDQRTRKTVWRDWRRGMGRDEYEETQGVNDFRDSQCDTRFANVLVCRPAPVRAGTGTATSGNGVRVVYVGTGTAKWFSYLSGQTAKYLNSTGTPAWTATSLTSGSNFYARGAGGHYYVWSSGSKISQSSDAITWNTVQVTGLDGMFASATVMSGLVLHDNKLFTMIPTDASPGLALCHYADAVTTPATATWTQLGTLVPDQDETVAQLFVWKFPPDPGRPGIYALTNRRIYWYDDTADAASVTAWKVWHTWDFPYATNGFSDALVHSATGDLYVMPSNAQDSIWQFTGSTIVRHAPNERGGLPPTRQGVMQRVAASPQGIVAWIRGGTQIGGTNTGMVVTLNEQDGWHHLLDANSTIAGFPVSESIAGGGLGPFSAITVMSGGQAWEQDFFDVKDLPQYATNSRTYDTTPLAHTTAKTDIGTPTLLKAALYVEINARIPTGASVAVAYRLDDYDGTGSFTTLATATDASSIPYRIGFPDNTRFRQCELRLTLARGVGASATPVIFSTVLHTALIVPARYVFQLRVDLRRARYKNAPKQFAGYGINSARTWVRNLHGQIASFTCGQPGDEITVSRAQVSVTPIEGPDGTGGRYLLQFRGLETPTSGS